MGMADNKEDKMDNHIPGSQEVYCDKCEQLPAAAVFYGKFCWKFSEDWLEAKGFQKPFLPLWLNYH